MKETVIDLIRHGEPQGGKRFRGYNIDDPLSEKGWQQMWDAVEGHSPWQKIISSPLQRCHAFAQALSQKHNIPVVTEAGLKEVGFGVWEGKTSEDLRQHRRDEYDAFYRDPIKNRPEGAEPFNVDDAYHSLKEGKIVPNKPNADTIADGLKTTLGDVTFNIISEYVKEIIRVTEQEIIEAMQLIWERMKIIIEPSSAVTLAAVLRSKQKFENKKGLYTRYVCANVGGKSEFIFNFYPDLVGNNYADIWALRETPAGQSASGKEDTGNKPFEH
mgnify:CR=1 FL=1